MTEPCTSEQEFWREICQLEEETVLLSWEFRKSCIFYGFKN